jgi:hypothetical protein
MMSSSPGTDLEGETKIAEYAEIAPNPGDALSCCRSGGRSNRLTDRADPVGQADFSAEDKATFFSKGWALSPLF